MDPSENQTNSAPTPPPASSGGPWNQPGMILKPFYPSGSREFVAVGCLSVLGVLLLNSWIWGGLNLGFACAGGGALLVSVIYLMACGKRPGFYTGAMLLLSLGILAGFARSDDAPVKFLLLLFLFFAVNISLCQTAGQNRYLPGAFATLGDAFQTLFGLGFGGMEPSFRGLRMARRNGQGKGIGSAVALGAVIALPLLLILLPLMGRADAAFAGLLAKLPDLRVAEIFFSVVLGVPVGVVLFTRNSALVHAPHGAPIQGRERKGLPAATINTVLLAVCLVFCVYLFSQLAYVAGGFSGLLPEGFTVAEYARRGFFEIAWLCALNLGILAGVLLFSGSRPLGMLTKLLCLFVGLFSLFLVATAAAKMGMYIRSFGLTRLRVLTMVVLLWLGVTLILVCLRLFVRKLPYMKGVLLAAMVIGAGVLWMDVDGVVARYNVQAYQAGTLAEVDVAYLGELNAAAVPWLEVLAEDGAPEVATEAAEILAGLPEATVDFRDWNYENQRAEEIRARYAEAEDAKAESEKTR